MSTTICDVKVSNLRMMIRAIWQNWPTTTERRSKMKTDALDAAMTGNPRQARAGLELLRALDATE